MFLPDHWQGNIIPYQELSGSYNRSVVSVPLEWIIPYQELSVVRTPGEAGGLG